MADDKYVKVATSGGEYVPDPSIFGGEERRFTVAPQVVSAKEYEALKQYKTDDGKQVFRKVGEA